MPPVNDAQVHQPVEPQWNCAVCGELWPCPAERDRLQHEFVGRPDLLGKHLQQQIEQAAPYVPLPSELYERFLSWALACLPLPQCEERYP